MRQILVYTEQMCIFCLIAIVSKGLLPEFICMLMDFSLAVFWNTFVLKHSFWEKHLKIIFFRKSFLSAIFIEVLVQMVSVILNYSRNFY